MQHATHTLQHATHTRQHATHTMQHATHNMQHATHTMQHATHTMQHATHTMQHAACALSGTPIRRVPPFRPDAHLRHRPGACRLLCHIGTGTGLAPPFLHRDWAHPSHICTGTRLAPSHICTGTALTTAMPAKPDWAHPATNVHAARGMFRIWRTSGPSRQPMSCVHTHKQRQAHPP